MSETTFSIQDCEQAIRQIKSVTAARINADQLGEIEEVHVLAGAGRSPKQVVRDIESVFAAQFGMEIDHKKISVAQVGDDNEIPPAYVESARPKLVGVTLRTVNRMAEVKVELLSGDQIIEGLASGPSSANNKLRLFAEATLKALAPLMSDQVTLVTEDVGLVKLGKQQAALVLVTIIMPMGEQSFTGCVLVQNDDREAVVKATLDAVNRKLRFLRTE